MNPETEISGAPSGTPNEGAYSYEGVEHPLVEKYMPEYLGGSGGHAVYEVGPKEKHGNVVIKIKKGPLWMLVSWNMATGRPISELTESDRELLEGYQRMEEERFRALQHHFGKDVVPNQKQFITNIPFTEPMLQDLFRNGVPEGMHEIPAIVVVQEKVPQLQEGGYFSLTDGHAFGNEIQPDLYLQQTDQLVLRNAPEGHITKDALVSAQENRHLDEILTLAENDPKLQAALTEIVRKIIQFTNATGEVLDLAEDNVILFQHDGEWKMRMADALYATYSQKDIGSANSALRDLAHGRQPTEMNGAASSVALSYVRVINGLARYLHLPDRILLFHEGRVSAEQVLELRQHYEKRYSDPNHIPNLWPGMPEK